MNIGIVADDLTGAADSMAPFAERGYASEVRFFQRGMTNHCAADALAIDTGSRDSPIKDTLRDLTFGLVTREILACEPTVIFKKIDSTLRGHLRVELDAMRAVLPERLPVVCSAFPANRRVIIDGELRLHGEPQNRSARAAFGYERNNSARTISLAELRRGADALSARLKAMRADGASCLFCDSETDADLYLLTQAILQSPADYLPVGSAGLAAAFARALPVKPQPHDKTATLLNVFKTGRVLVVVGSLHEVSRNQLRHFSERTGVLPIVPKNHNEFDAQCHEIDRALEAGKRFALIATPEKPIVTPPSCALAVRSLLFSLHKDWNKQREKSFDALFVTGGSSAREAMVSLNGNGLRIAGEIQPGVVLGRMNTNDVASQIFHDFPVLLKSGGFGTLNVIATLLGLD